MPLLTSQERNVIIFLLSTALTGSVIRLFRNNWLKNPEILLSPKILLSYISKIEEEKNISNHNLAIKDQLQKSDIEETYVSIKLNRPDGNISSKSSVELLPSNAVNKTKSEKKKITQNTSELININIASKEDFIKLPYIGEVKAERIIQLRDEMGAFVSIKDLEKVKGIGQKILTR